MRTDDQLPDPGVLYVVIRGRMIPREAVRYFEYGSGSGRESMAPVEDRGERGVIYRVMSAATWPLVLCVLEWHPEMDEGMRLAAIKRDAGQAGVDQEHTPDLMVIQNMHPVQVQMLTQMQAQIRASEQKRIDAEREAEKALRAKRPRMIVDFKELAVRRVPETYLQAARGELELTDQGKKKRRTLR
jgi:hypothetical protein